MLSILSQHNYDRAKPLPLLYFLMVLRTLQFFQSGQSCIRAHKMMPMSSRDVVLGKYFAALSLILIPDALIACYSVIAGFFGSVDHMASYASVFGLLLFEAAWLSVCMLIGSNAGLEVTQAGFIKFMLISIKKFHHLNSSSQFINFTILSNLIKFH